MYGKVDKMCRPLRGKKIPEGFISTHDLAEKRGTNWFFASDVKSAVEFYKKYLRDIDMFAYNYPKEHNKFIEINEPLTWISWSDWLFNYCFADVIE